MKRKTFDHADDYNLDDLAIITNLKAKTTDKGRVYLADGIQLPSVTTVCGFEKAAFFAKWRADNPKEARRVTVRGNRFHLLIEKYLGNEEIDEKKFSLNEWDLFYQLQPELDKITKVHALEVPLFSTTVGLAGRVDCVAEHDGKLCVIDFKGSNRQKRSEDIENYFLQATAYSLMWQEMTNRPADAFKILISSEDGSVQVFEGKPIKYVKRLREVINRYYEYMGETKELINTTS